MGKTPDIKQKDTEDNLADPFQWHVCELEMSHTKAVLGRDVMHLGR